MNRRVTTSIMRYHWSTNAYYFTMHNSDFPGYYVPLEQLPKIVML